MVRHAERAWQRSQIEEALSGRNGGPQPTKMAKMETQFESLSLEESPDFRWKKLRDGFDAIFCSDGERKSLSQEEYMNLYSDVYNFYCKAEVEPRPDLSSEFASVDIAGLNLYERIESYLQNHLKMIGKKGAEVPSEGIFQFYAEQCDKFYFSSSVLDSICAYLNRRMIIPARKNGAKVLEIYDLALHSWKNTLFRTMHEQVTMSVLAAIDKERRGEVVNTGYMKSVSSSYVELGVLGGRRDRNLEVYKSCFENRFLQETEDFYTRVSPEFIDNNYISEYTKKVEKWMEEENNRVRRFLHQSTLPKVISICGKLLIERHFERLKTHFVALLPAVKEDDEVAKEDLGRTFRLSSKFETYLVILAQEFQNFVFELGLADLRLGENDAIKSVKAILVLYNNYGKLVRDAFQSNLKFSKALDKAFIAFMNANPALKVKSRCPQYLARYLDQLLKPKKIQDETEQIENNINDAVALFRFIQDKDVFQQYYRNALSARLLLQRYSSDEMENLVLNKLETTCGNEYTNRLRRMLSDIAGSKGINQEFKNYLEEKEVVLSHEFYVKVLAVGSWPKMPQQSFTLPPDMERGVNEFIIFYNGKHTGKKLIWSLQNSSGELKYETPKNGPFTIGASAHQMAILLLFNNSDDHTVGEIEEATKLDYEILKQTLWILLGHMILQRKYEDEKDPLTRESQLCVFENFNPVWKRRHNINVPLKTEIKAGEAEAQSDIDKNRKIVIQAAIVRIMKTRKAMKHQKLITEVIDQLKNRFSPDVCMIRDCIETMIEKEYLARDENDRKSYTYTA